MKARILLALFFVSTFCFSQSVNDYIGVIVPTKFDFMKSENQYRIATLTKHYLQQAGFRVYYSNEELPLEFYGNRCSLLNVDVVKDNAFLATKLLIVFKDCYGKTIYTSEAGKSKIKEFEPAYKEALEGAFVSVKALSYHYNGTIAKDEVVKKNVAVTTTATTQSVTMVAPSPNVVSPNLLYAQPTETGYQLIDKTPKVVMKLMKTSQPNSFIAIKDGIQGNLTLKDNQWIFEFYKDDKLMTESLSIKF